MRLWSLHPRYLDAKGLVALWREALLAQAVLRGETRGYTRHPQLARFQAQPAPLEAMAAYLRAVQTEATARGYSFDAGKIGQAGRIVTFAVTQGQIDFERQHLEQKLAVRDPARLLELKKIEQLEPHPLFTAVPGPIEPWEKPG